ncbi:MAG: M48 family metallopeptidase [Acutalibacteraceae bacterium]
MEYKLIRSRRKTLSIEITEHCEVIVRAPMRLSQKIIDDFVNSKSDWIDKKLLLVSERVKNKKNYTDDEILRLRKKAEEILPEKIEFWSKITGLKPTGVKITTAKKRFGSCSAKNSLCFSVFLFDYPDEAVDYVVVHELCHIKEHNHSMRFWRLVESFLPDYKAREKLLKRQ